MKKCLGVKNLKAASDLLDKVEKAILERKYACYRIYVDNFIIYYVIIILTNFNI